MKHLIVFLLILGMMFGTSHSVFADDLNSNSYKIQFGNFNITSGKKGSTSYTITDTVGQTAPGQFGLNGYVIKSGFQYVYTIGTFGFSISKTLISLGTITPGSFSATDTTTLTVSAKGAGGYTVTAFENNPLKLQNGSATIPDTNCDTSCTPLTAASWITATKPGFGYNMSGNDIPATFVNSNYFRPFANFSASVPAQTVMSSAAAGKNRQATVTFKGAITASQAAGTYENVIVFIAIPGY